MKDQPPRPVVCQGRVDTYRSDSRGTLFTMAYCPTGYGDYSVYGQRMTYDDAWQEQHSCWQQLGRVERTNGGKASERWLARPPAASHLGPIAFGTRGTAAIYLAVNAEWDDAKAEDESTTEAGIARTSPIEGECNPEAGIARCDAPLCHGGECEFCSMMRDRIMARRREAGGSLVDAKRHVEADLGLRPASAGSRVHDGSLAAVPADAGRGLHGGSLAAVPADAGRGLHGGSLAAVPADAGRGLHDGSLAAVPGTLPEGGRDPEPDTVRPDFKGFANALRAEAEWSATIHRGDNAKGGTGQAATDQAALNRLAEHVEKVGKALGFM